MSASSGCILSTQRPIELSLPHTHFLAASFIPKLYLRARASLNSCLLRQNPNDLSGSDESQELAPFSDVRSNCNFWVSFRSFVTSSFLSLKNSILDFRISVLISTSFSENILILDWN